MPANVESMAYYGEIPWHGLGTEVQKGINATEMIKAAGMDWKVEMQPARGAVINKKGKASRYEIIRLPRPGTLLAGFTFKSYLRADPIYSFQEFRERFGEHITQLRNLKITSKQGMMKKMNPVLSEHGLEVQQIPN